MPWTGSFSTEWNKTKQKTKNFKPPCLHCMSALRWICLQVDWKLSLFPMCLYHHDPGALAIDAFTLKWQGLQFYVFLLFAVIHRVLEMIQQEGVQGVTMVPDWPTRPWYNLLAHLYLQSPVLLSLILPAAAAQPPRLTPCSTAQAAPAGLPCIQHCLRAREFSTTAEDFFLYSWWNSIQKQ